MTFDKPSSLSSLARTGSVLSALVIAAFLLAGSLTTVQQTSATTTLTIAEQNILDTQDQATENLSESDRDVNGIEFTPRWGGVSLLQPNDVKVLFADCLEDEFAVSYMSMFESPDVVDYQSFPVAFPDDYMSWLAVVKNTDTNSARVASIGVICADENSGDEDDVNIDISTKTTIQNIVNNFVRVENNQVINLNNIVEVHQTITQNAYQIADQAANVTGGGGNVVDQAIDQNADQAANVTGGGPADVDQAIDQDADQVANVTGGGGNVFDQFLDQDADQVANVTGGGGNVFDQFLGQDADQSAQ